MIIDYGTLKFIWWLFIVVLFVFFFVLGGRDFGVCMLLPWKKADASRRLMINSIGSTWEGNQVWFVTAGGATFAAWPLVYATAFSGLYYALFIVLVSLILRPPGFDFRSKLDCGAWRTLWDYALFLSGFVPALIFGVGLGNLFLGLPFQFDEAMHSHYEGTFWQLLSPFTVVFGLASVTLLAFHGGVFLQTKVGEEVLTGIRTLNAILGLIFIALFIGLGMWLHRLSGFSLDPIQDIHAVLLPMHKSASVTLNAWYNNYALYPKLWGFPVAAVVATVLAVVASLVRCPKVAFTLSSVSITAALATAAVALFPFILPSSLAPNHSLTVWDAVSSHRTLFYMFWAAICFLPIILAYTTWVFRVLRGQLVAKEVLNKHESY